MFYFSPFSLHAFCVLDSFSWNTPHQPFLISCHLWELYVKHICEETMITWTYKGEHASLVFLSYFTQNEYESEKSTPFHTITDFYSSLWNSLYDALPHSKCQVGTLDSQVPNEHVSLYKWLQEHHIHDLTLVTGQVPDQLNKMRCSASRMIFVSQ